MARAFCRFAPGRYRREVILCWARYSGAATNRQSVFNEQQRAGAGRSAPAQGSSSNGRGQNIICLPFARALPAFSNSPAASLGQGADVMVEGETLLVLLLCAPCQRSALQGSSSNGGGRNITCFPFAKALPASSNSPAASQEGRSCCNASLLMPREVM